MAGFLVYDHRVFVSGHHPYHCPADRTGGALENKYGCFSVIQYKPGGYIGHLTEYLGDQSGHSGTFGKPADPEYPVVQK